MFGQFLTRLTAPDPEILSDDDARLALAAVLVRVARSDNSYDRSEIDSIDRVLGERYQLSAVDAESLRHNAETLETEAPDTVRFTKAIKNAVSVEERIGVVEALWSIVLADGHRDHAEDAQLRMISKLLGINDRDSALARQRVASRMS